MNPAKSQWTIGGFTLIEMLVVLVVISTLLGLVSVNAQPGARDLLQLEAERLAQIMELAAEESRISGKSIAWTADGSGYRFWRLDADDEWLEIRDSDLLRARSLPPGMAISNLRVEDAAPSEFLRVEFSPGGAAMAFIFDLSLGNESYAVAASPVGDLRVAPGKGKSYAEMESR